MAATDVDLDQLRAAVARRRDELVELTRQFVAFATENPPGTELAACQQWICEQLQAFGIEHETIDSATDGGPERIIVGTVGAGGPTMYLHGHYDVVPAFGPGDFDAVERDGALFGRGTCDMKGGLVAMLLAAVIHRERNGGGRLKLVFVPDEETGGANGAERLDELGLLDPAAIGAIVAEPSWPDIWYAARGAFTVEVTVTGRPAHVGLHHRGDNAFLRANAIVAELASYAEEVAGHRTELRIEPEAARRSIMLIGGTAGGGTNFNIVPDRFTFTIDRRTPEGGPHRGWGADLLARLDALADHHPLTYRILQDVDPALTAPDHRLITTVVDGVEEIGGRHASPSMCPGCLETRVYGRAGIPAVAYGPGPMAVMHAPDEHVPIANLVEACTVYAAVLARYLG